MIDINLLNPTAYKSSKLDRILADPQEHASTARCRDGTVHPTRSVKIAVFSKNVFQDRCLPFEKHSQCNITMVEVGTEEDAF